jgi:general secretion pathway protein H
MVVAVYTETRAQRGFATRSERRRARGPSQGPRVDASQCGFTLIEIILVLAIIGLVMGLGLSGLRSLARSDLRADSTHLAGAMRFLFDRASTTGKVHRLVLDLEGGKYWAEVTDDKFFVPRDVETPDQTRRREEQEAQQDKEAEDKRRAAEKSSSTAASDTYGASSGLPMDSSYDPAKLEVGEFQPKRARFGAFKEMALKPVTLNKHVVFRSVYTPRATEPVTSGRAYVYFFPLGQTEAAIVSLSDPEGESVYSLVAHPITGRVRVYNEEVKPPVGPQTDDTGATVTP